MHRELRLIAVLGALAVGLGAFGAHGLERLVEPAQLETFGTGVRYQFYHVLAAALAIALGQHAAFSGQWLRRAIWCWVLGIALFSGSLYLLALRDVHGLAVGFLGPITPLGGLFFIGGWMMLLFAPVARR
ncbi:DUF423 domain-containing protein [Neolewinella lacunae]|uniref:DUF423 domain-containing protein n=1 Tax=Neolewinella lacunae TaxID=1517758 RepID=A0A923T6H1_9BACT|nr:DUF423 domain-containing protein [Neolewinella lacunae]MBC6993415.1 DUF423 domain-containing protein [Neolewinella lacunae]MDN3636309.1 DUF423 domain-containing protein [Neolewinella lacunae]